MDTVRAKTAGRERLAFGLAAIAILLRLASDWVFPAGGPFGYQLLQAVLLLLAVIALSPHLEVIFLRNGNARGSIREGLLAVPLGLLMGLGLSWLRFGGLHGPTFDQAVGVVANNLFFPAVEELEFRGFMLAWLVSRKTPPVIAIWLVAILHVLAHPHYIWQGSYLNLATALLLFAWFGWLTLRTRSLWGAYVAHAASNIFLFLPVIGSGFVR